MTPAVPKTSGSYGQVVWLPGGFLSADATRALGELDLFAADEHCALCHAWAPLQRGHIIRKGLGGRPKGSTGPTLRLCEPCHTRVDRHGSETLAVSEDGEVCLLSLTYGGVSRRSLGVFAFRNGMEGE